MVLRGLWRWAPLVVALSLPSGAIAQAPASGGSAAPALMKRGLYRDAVRALLADVKKRPESQSGRQFLMLGESYYMLKDYGQARPYFAKARRHCSDARDQAIVEYRLACCAYRLRDAAGALEKIDAFAKKHPADSRTGTLLVFKMKVLTGRGKAAEPQIEAVHQQIAARRTYSSAVRLAADKLLTEYYLAHGQEAKATQRYASIVHNFRNVISQYAREKRPVPRGMEQAHDHAAMQLGVLSVKAKRFDDAVRWLENVRYDGELKNRARLLLAQVAYQRRDFGRARNYLTRDGLLETVPPGALRSDMCLLLGLCEKGRANPNPAKVESYLKQVAPDSKGYLQAQASLGDLYREKGLTDRAIRAFTNAVASPRYEAHALFNLGELTMAQAAETTDASRQAALYKQAAGHFSQLSTRYPAALLTRQASTS
ncbi:MAG: tetratricopeptide repeat protein, partial [Planctomycetota bacterium]